MTVNAYDKRFAAQCSPGDMPAINAALANVSGAYADMFRLPCLYEGDADPVRNPDGTLDWSGTTIRSYSTGIVMTTKAMRRVLGNAVSPWITSANWREVDARGERFPDGYELFLSEYQLRKEFSFVQATGRLRSKGGLPSQTLGIDQQNAVLLNQWENLSDARNVRLDGTGQRMSVDYPGTYDVEIRISWENPESNTIYFQLAMDTTWIGLMVSQTDESMRGTFSGISFATTSQKLGLGVWSDVVDVDFKVVNGWLGIKRTA